MVEVSVRGDRVHFEVEGWDKLWAFRSQLEIPVSHIKSVRIDREIARGWWHGLRIPGTNVPGILTAGNFYQVGEGWAFYDVHDTDKTIVVELDHEQFRQLVIEVLDPPAVLQQLLAAIKRETA